MPFGFPSEQAFSFAGIPTKFPTYPPTLMRLLQQVFG